MLGASPETVFPGGVWLKSPVRCGRVKTEAEAPVPTAAQEHLKPDGVDGALRSYCDRALNHVCFQMGGEKEYDSERLRGTSDNDAS